MDVRCAGDGRLTIEIKPNHADSVALEEIPIRTLFEGEGRGESGGGCGFGIWFKTSTHLVGLNGSVYDTRESLQGVRFHRFRRFTKMVLE